MTRPSRRNKNKKSKKNKPAFYIVFDGRAAFDVDDAAVLQDVGEMDNDMAALSYMRSAWSHCDCVLFRYEQDGGKLINGTMIGSTVE